MSDGKFYLILMGIFLFIQGIFAMLEMACVSFNRVRLQYWVAQNKKRAKWLSYLLKKPTLLFGATLIGVNVSLQIGSECARRFYEAMGLNPDWAPISQILFVILLAELAPMFAGRRHPEHVAMLGVPLLYVTSVVLRPLIWLFDWLCQGINALLGLKGSEGAYLSREELQHLFEQLDEEQRVPRGINTVVANILSIKGKFAKDLMTPIHEVQMVPSFCTIAEVRALLSNTYHPYLPIYQRNPRQVLGIIYPRDLLRASEKMGIAEYARPAWFITAETAVLHILKQFRRNNQSIAIVLSEAGNTVGVLTLDKIVDTIFGKIDVWEAFEGVAPRMHHVIVDRTFLSDMQIDLFNKTYRVHLEADGMNTFEELMQKKLGHSPEKGESIHIDQFELTVEETPLIGPKKIGIRTVF